MHLDGEYVDTLAAAYAEVGRFDAATASAKQAIELASAETQPRSRWFRTLLGRGAKPGAHPPGDALCPDRIESSVRVPLVPDAEMSGRGIWHKAIYRFDPLFFEELEITSLEKRSTCGQRAPREVYNNESRTHAGAKITHLQQESLGHPHAVRKISPDLERGVEILNRSDY